MFGPSLRSLECPSKGVLSGDALDTVGGIDVLDECDLPAGSGSLTRDDGRVREEIFPDLRGLAGDMNNGPLYTYPEPFASIFSLDLLSVCHPVSVPSP